MIHQLPAFCILLFLSQKPFMRKLSRKSFLFVLNAGIVAFFVFLWERLTSDEIKRMNNKTSQFTYQKGKKVTFADKYIVIDNEGKLTVFSDRCTHLGCRIREFSNDKLVCPCHGSEYDLSGTPLKGPAYKSLEKVNAEFSADGKTIIIAG
jgi:Rieske Fe-S protein